MKKNKEHLEIPIFERIVDIIEQARESVALSVNTNMVVAYWLIGKEIVEEVQNGDQRASYGKQLLENLSAKLTIKYGSGFSVTSLKYFRTFYQVYKNRLTGIGRPPGDLLDTGIKGHPVGDEFKNNQSIPGDVYQPDKISKTDEKQYPIDKIVPAGFSPRLSWSHYRALMRIKKDDARLFYEQESIECGWDKRTLERHIHSQYYERLLKSQHPVTMYLSAREEITKKYHSSNILKNPYVLEFLGLPDSSSLHETQLEAAIINHLQTFLLELGKGFAFVGRQKRLRFDEKDLYIDLVFYNCILKCYLLIDLKIGELSYRDVGQMDGYVRMFDDLYTASDDNPTIGLILCTEKNEAVAKYSVLNDRRQIFASKYMLYLPTEEELRMELKKERKLIEESWENRE